MRQHQELAVAQITSNEMIMMALKQVYRVRNILNKAHESYSTVYNLI